ncbi:MAG: TlpA family protein disulfide reductase [Rhodobacteraceae bacterium]|jgi:thiol-disulfide isomerase/thioredoxin|nr:TlpA family protein disulfide reductase [Paracoccaceae bacterium]
MRNVLATIYTALILGANVLGANPARADVSALRAGDMLKLNLVEATALPDVAIFDGGGAPHSLSQWQGQWVVLNFWATWCAPCRHEMPSLDRLQAAIPELAVLPVATGRNSAEGITRFYEEAAVTGLPVLLDPKSELARAMGVLGLPVTVIVNPEGAEVARLIGDAAWDSADAQTVLKAMMAAAKQ